MNLLSGRYGYLDHFKETQTVPDPRNLSATFFVCHGECSAPQNADRQTVARRLFHARQFHIDAAFAVVVLLIRHAAMSISILPRIGGPRLSIRTAIEDQQRNHIDFARP